ncbi:MAG: primosomal protein N' [Leptospiraceae bacterium]|nr:primosomal protein N' [Leptospiraceae bacterium]
MIRYAEVALNVSFEEETLTYEIPDNMKNLQIGMRVEIPLRGRKNEGIVIDIHRIMPNHPTKEIIRQVDKRAVVNKEQIELAKWMSETYLSTLGEGLYKMIPSGRKNKSIDFISSIANEKLLDLNSEQSKAFQEIQSKLGSESIHLLYGITGSGKTEVYIHLIKEVLTNSDKSVIFLVPEISLTVQTFARLENVFKNQVAILHSTLKVSERFSSYISLLDGKKRIAVGTRSAIFAPVKNLGLIIIDEEHDHSYKEHSTPRYHTRQIALQRCRINQASLILGSATPSIEVFYQAKVGKIHLHKLTKRAKTSLLPKIIIHHKKDNSELLGDELLHAIKDRLSKKEQVILLLNRRGHSPLIYLREEKKFLECPNCTTHLCFHSRGKAICHLCGYKESISSIEKKYSNDLEYIGSGTQKLEEYLLEKFKNAVVERLDQDSATKKEIFFEVIGKLLEGKINILTGTQMIAKGLDASMVTLVGVINANTGLGVPDFRSNERVYSLLTQVAGRAGRADLKGEVIIETTNTDHPVIQLAKDQNYEKFFQFEIQFRKDAYYPPYCRLVRFVVRSKLEEKSKFSIEEIKKEIDLFLLKNTNQKIIVLGPAECPFYKIDSNYRNHIVLKTLNLTILKNFIREKIKPLKFHKSVYLEIDFDPMDLL